MPQPNARISRVHGSWRVRVFGYAPKFFADSDYDGDESKSLKAARVWRDEHWDGADRSSKLTRRQRNAIRRSKAHYLVVAAKYKISPNYVHQLRREDYE